MVPRLYAGVFFVYDTWAIVNHRDISLETFDLFIIYKILKKLLRSLRFIHYMKYI